MRQLLSRGGFEFEPFPASQGSFPTSSYFPSALSSTHVDQAPVVGSFMSPYHARDVETNLGKEKWDGEQGTTGSCDSLKSPELMPHTALDLRWLPEYWRDSKKSRGQAGGCFPVFTEILTGDNVPPPAPNVRAHACNPSIREAEIGRPMGLNGHTVLLTQ